MGTTITSSKSWTIKNTAIKYNVDGTVNLQSSSGRTITAHDSRTTGDNAPHWRKKLRQHVNASSSLVGEGYLFRAGSCFGKQQQRSTKQWVLVDGVVDYGSIGFNAVSSSISSAADNRARSKVLADYLRIRNNWRGGNFLAEVRETIHMFHHPLDTAYLKTIKWLQSINDAKKRFKGDALAKALASDWLAYVFGLKPLVNDIQDAIPAWEKLWDPDNWDVHSLHGLGYDRSQNTQTFQQTVSLQGGTAGTINCTYDKVQSFVSAVKYYGQVKARPFGFGSQMEKFGVDPFDVAPAVWEAIPFSWFVDYFVNVSEVLDGCRLWNAESAWMNRGVRNSSTVTAANVRTVSSDATWQNREISGHGWFTAHFKVFRDAIGGVPHPNWVFKMPGFPSLRWLNIAAVLEQRNYGIK